MNEIKKSRAALMAEQYADKLRGLGVAVPDAIEPDSEEQTLEQLERLKKATAKLRTFKDLIY
jgi:hypothetical protein